MKYRLSGILSKIVYALLAVGFLIALSVLFFGSSYGYSAPFLAIGTAAALALILAFRRAVKKHEAFFTRHSRLITLGFLLFMFLLQLALSFPLRYQPVYDVDALFGGAAEWVSTGTFEDYYEYFSMFHNNFGGLLLFRVWFGILALLGVSDFFIPACILNALLSAAAMYLTASSAGKLFGVRGRMTACFLFLISPPFYFIAPAFYTDALTMVFPALILRLFLEAGEQTSLDKRLACFVLMGLACAVGYGIKATVLIMLIAAVIDGMLYCGFKRFLPLAAIAAVLTVGLSLAVSGIIYQHIGREQAKQKQIPITHWIMMGLSGWGGYNNGDYAFTKGFDDPAERSEAIKEKIAERVRERGITGMTELFIGKLDIVFNDGTYGLSDCLGGPHEKDNFLHEFLVKSEGAPRYIYKHICTAVLAALYLVVTVSCVLDVFGKGGTVRLLAPRLALLGLFIFFLIWEARWRYFSNYVPIIMLSAVIGLESFLSIIDSLSKNRRERKAEVNAVNETEENETTETA